MKVKIRVKVYPSGVKSRSGLRISPMRIRIFDIFFGKLMQLGKVSKTPRGGGGPSNLRTKAAKL